MRLSKTAREEANAVRRDRALRERHRELVVLARIAHVDHALQSAHVGINLFAREPGFGLLLQRSKDILNFVDGIRSERDKSRCGEIGPQVGQKKAHGAKNAGSARDEDATDLKLPRKACRMQGAGATKCDESIVARIVTTLDRDDPDRARHVGGNH
jgi:hypothetical protein